VVGDRLGRHDRIRRFDHLAYFDLLRVHLLLQLRTSGSGSCTHVSRAPSCVGTAVPQRDTFSSFSTSMSTYGGARSLYCRGRSRWASSDAIRDRLTLVSNAQLPRKKRPTARRACGKVFSSASSSCFGRSSGASPGFAKSTFSVNSRGLRPSFDRDEIK